MYILLLYVCIPSSHACVSFDYNVSYIAHTKPICKHTSMPCIGIFLVHVPQLNRPWVQPLHQNFPTGKNTQKERALLQDLQGKSLLIIQTLNQLQPTFPLAQGKILLLRIRILKGRMFLTKQCSLHTSFPKSTLSPIKVVGMTL